jgi:predicted GH43/DUF377 family glycosyl hydrolase
MHSSKVAAGIVLLLFIPFWGAAQPKGNKTENSDWKPISFRKILEVYPVLKPDTNLVFHCPVTGQDTKWQATYLFNPAAVVHNGKVFLLFRAEDKVGRHGGTSRIGLAESTDGLHFTKHKDPVLYPDKDDFLELENEGGIEDPRVTETEGGMFIMTYTAFNGTQARLCVATSPDLVHWTKRGLAFKNEAFQEMWSKSGSIVSRQEGDRIVATKINGKYWMYWGESNIYLASSDDLVEWQPSERTEYIVKKLAFRGNGNYDITYDKPRIALQTALTPRKGRFDNTLVEAGPPALLTDKGIYLIYNGLSMLPGGDSSLISGAYTVSQVLFDRNDPTAVIRRSKSFFLKASTEEGKGQLANTAFIEGMVHFKGKWFVYYTMAEANIGVANIEFE